MKKKVSIVCLTYNHERSISNALEGMFSQKTTFDYEIIVHDDASTDGTTQILEKYEKRYGEMLKVYYEEDNQYSKGQIAKVLNQLLENEAEGEYIAFCEGDDYWIDNNKLQIQIDYMDNHPKCTMSGHNSLWVDNITNVITVCNGIDAERKVTLEEIIRNRRGCFATASMVFRKEYFFMPKVFAECSIGDWPLKLYCAEQGEVFYFDRIMSVYNQNTSNSWSDEHTRNKIKRIVHELEMTSYFLRLNEHWELKYKDEIDKQVDSFVNDIIYLLNSENVDVESKICDIDRDTKYRYSDACNMVIKKIWRRTEEIKKVKDFVNKFSWIFIMGCGVQAKKLKELLDELGISIEGFVVSNHQTAPFKYCEKKVWRLCDLPYDKKEIGVLVGIQNDINVEIIQSLQDNDIRNYFWPSI